MENKTGHFLDRRINNWEQPLFPLHQPGLADKEDLNRQPALVHVEIKEVPWGLIIRNDLLLLHRDLNIVELVTNFGSPFVLQITSRLVHPCQQVLLHIRGIAIKERLNPLNLGRVLGWRNFLKTGPQALSHVVIQAGTPLKTIAPP